MAQQVFPAPITNLQLIRQAEGGSGHAGVKEGRAAFNTMRHQAAIKLDQQIMRQPIGAIGRLRHLQTGPPRQRGGGFRSGNAIAPARQRFAQHIQPIKSAMPAHGFATQPPGAHGGTIPAIAAE